jgi:hypothetical protein
MSTPKKDTADAKKKVVNVDNTSAKYKILLKYCNKLLENVEGVDQIKDVLEFKGVNRLDLVKDEGQQVNKEEYIEMGLTNRQYVEMEAWISYILGEFP